MIPSLSLLSLKPKVHSTIKSRAWLFKRSERLFLELAASQKNAFQLSEENDSKEHFARRVMKNCRFFSTSQSINLQLDDNFFFFFFLVHIILFFFFFLSLSFSLFNVVSFFLNSVKEILMYFPLGRNVPCVLLLNSSLKLRISLL